jgi:TPP-dependent pyruvate/acetoin dehydrogenase alpha subunit
MTGEEFERIDSEVSADVEAAVEFAKNGTDPQPEDAVKWVYADGSMERNA